MMCTEVSLRYTRCYRRYLGAVIAMAVLAEPVAAQALQSRANVALDRGAEATSAVRLVPSPSCRSCRIGRRVVATVSDSLFDVDFSRVVVGRDAAGRFLIVGRGGVIGIFDSTGRFLRPFGRSGSGPGEFRGPVAIAHGERDSVFVSDQTLARITVLDPGLMKAVRTMSAPRHLDLLPLAGGRLLIAGYVASSAAAGQPLHLLRSDGSVQRSFGVDSARVGRAPERTLSRSIMRLPDGDVLSASMDQYRLTRWGDDYRKQRVFERTVEWFPRIGSEERIDQNFARSPIPAQLVAVAAGPTNNTVLVSVVLGRKDFKPDPRLRGRTGEVAIIPDKPMGLYINEYMDTIVEILDLKTGEVLASRRFRGVYGTISHTPYHWFLRERSDGALLLEIARFELLRTVAATP